MYRISGGLSNVKVSSAEFGEASHQVLDYLLFSPPGPALPFVLTPATLDDKLKFCLVYKQEALTHAEARHLLERFLAELENFQHLPQSPVGGVLS